MRAERRTVECATGGVRLLGGRRTDRGLVLVPQVRGWGSGRQDSDYGSGASVESSKQCPGVKNLPANRGQKTGTSLSWFLRVGPEPANRSAAPPTKLRIFPDTLTSCPCCDGSAVGSLSRGSLPGPLREIPFLSLVFSVIPLNFAIHAVQSSARKPSRNDEFSSGLAAFWFLWSAGGSAAPQCRRAGFSSALAL